MEDREIVELFWRRDESAIRQVSRRLGAYLTTIARNVLGSEEDSREVVNDAYLAAWNSIPPHRPEALDRYLGKIVREKAIDRLRGRERQRRVPPEGLVSLSELEECVPGGGDPGEQVDRLALEKAVGEWLAGQSKATRRAFVGRYYYMDPVKDIARYLELRPEQVKSALRRARRSLREYLEKEGLL